jgi:hypothetical protein
MKLLSRESQCGSQAQGMKNPSLRKDVREISAIQLLYMLRGGRAGRTKVAYKCLVGKSQGIKPHTHTHTQRGEKY